MTFRERFNRAAMRVLVKINDFVDLLEGVETGYTAHIDHENVSDFTDEELVKFREEWAKSCSVADELSKPVGFVDLGMAATTGPTPGEICISEGEEPEDYDPSWIKYALLHLCLEGKIKPFDFVRYETAKTVSPAKQAMAIKALNEGLAEKFSNILLEGLPYGTADLGWAIYKEFDLTNPLNKGITLTELRASATQPSARACEQIDAIRRRTEAEKPKRPVRDHWWSRPVLDGWGTLDKTPARLQALLLEKHNETADAAEEQLKQATDALEEMKLIADETMEAQLMKIKALQHVITDQRLAAETARSQEPVADIVEEDHEPS